MKRYIRRGSKQKIFCPPEGWGQLLETFLFPILKAVQKGAPKAVLLGFYGGFITES